MGKISIITIFLIFLSCAAVQKKPELTFNDCLYQCTQLTYENDKDGITLLKDSQPYILYLCGLACREKATEREWADFIGHFEFGQQYGDFI